MELLGNGGGWKVFADLQIFGRVYTLRFRKGHRGHLPVGMLSTARVAEGSDKGNLFLIL
jgi:hypothetical protein